MTSPLPPHASLARLSIIALGASTAVLQTLAIREGLAVASGNEAVIALLFGVWLVFTAIGASAARSNRRWLAIETHHALVFYGVAIPFTLLAARLSPLLLDPGSTPTLLSTALASVVVLAPACACSGWIYARLAKGSVRDDPDEEARTSARAYWLDTLGAGVAGVLLAWFALDHVLPFRLAAAASAVIVGLAALAVHRGLRIGYLAVAVALALAFGAAPIDALTFARLLPGQTTVDLRVTSRGILLSTIREGQTQVLLQREPVLVPSDSLAGEQVGSLPTAMHPAPLRAAFFGIPPGDALTHLLDHGVRHVDVIAGDAGLARAILDWAPGARDPRVTIHPSDERAFARSYVGPPFDLIAVHAGMPTSIGSARLVSVEFFTDLSRSMDPRAVLVVTAAPHAAYATQDSQRMHATFAATTRSVFRNVQVLPADWTLYVASNEALPSNDRVAPVLLDRLRQRSIRREVLTTTWIEDRMSADRVGQANLWASASVSPSTDKHPVVFRAALDAALAPVGGGLGVLFAIAMSLVAVLVAWVSPRSRPVSYSVATTGFAGLAMQLVVMLVHQTAVGTLYRDVALVTAAYMGSSCLGTWWASKRPGHLRLLIAADGAQLFVAVAIAAFIPTMASSHSTAAQLTTMLAAASVGLVTGAQIAWASRAGAFVSGVAGTVYAIDLAGAALAALITVNVVVPSVGLAGTCWIVAGLKASSVAALAWRGRMGRTEDRPIHVPIPAALLVVVVGTVIAPAAERHVVAWTRSSAYSVAVLAVLGAALLAAFEPRSLRARIVSWERRLRGMAARIGLSPLRALQFAILLPVAALPLGRCFFSIPYLFCHVCPRPCVFGVMRPYVAAGALLANLGDRRFCERVCPLGQAQASAWKGSRTHRPITRVVLWSLRVVVLALVVVLYVQARAGRPDDVSGVFAWFYAYGYETSFWALVSAGLILAAAFALHRPFCDGLCPIGAMSDLIGRLERRWVRAGRVSRGDADD